MENVVIEFRSPFRSSSLRGLNQEVPEILYVLEYHHEKQEWLERYVFFDWTYRAHLRTTFTHHRG